MRTKILVWALSIFVLLASCGEYQKVYKSKDTSLKYQKAMSLYQDKQYAKSAQLLEQLRDMYRRTDSLEVVYYRLAMCYYNLKDYPFASLFFKDFTDNFTASPRAVECAYMALYCDFLGIGSHDLDQSETRNVLEAMQNFTNFHPDSEYTEKCNQHIDELRNKLQKKEYDMVMQYYNMTEYKSAVTASKNTVKLYPDIPEREELEYIAVKAQYLYAKNSIESKRKERYQLVVENFEDYKYNNPPSSKHYEECTNFAETSKKEIKKMEELL